MTDDEFWRNELRQGTHPMDVVREAIAAEREACAKVAEAVQARWMPDVESSAQILEHGKKVAASIRARGGS